MKILLVVPQYSEVWGEFYQYPLGLGYITSAMKKAGHQVTVLNLNHEYGQTEEIIAKKIDELDPDVCCSGGLSPYLPQIKKIFSASRQAKKDIINIAGGGVVSGEPGVILDAADINVGVVGEGEATIPELLSYLETGGNLNEVQGIVFKGADNRTIQTPERPQIKDLSVIAWPDYEALEVEKNINNQRALDSYFFQSHPTSQPISVDMVTSRSCPFKCTFCFHPTGKVYRERPLDDFFAELDMLVERYNINMIGLVDELFSLKKARLLEFCERIKPYNLQWMVQLHVKSVNDETMEAMRDAGCAYISFGIESMSQPVLESMQKKSKTAEIDYALDLTYKYKIGIQGNILFGDSSETLETANESMHWWSKNRRYQINLTPLMVFPGSPDYLTALRDGLIKEEDRLSFIENIPPVFNISKINDPNMDMIRLQVWVFSETLLNVAEVQSFELSDNQVAGRAPAYDIDWNCPRCDHHNNYHGAILPPHAGYTLRLSCRACGSRFDIKNKMYQAPQTNTIDDQTCLERYQKAKNHFEKANYSKCHNIANQLMRDAPNFIPARLLMGEFYRQVGPAEHMVRSFGSALGMDPLNPDRHLDFADALREVGAFGAARMHYEQALHLGENDEKALDGLHFIDGPQISDEQRGTYFISWSDEEPPVRNTSHHQCGQEKPEPTYVSVKLDQLTKLIGNKLKPKKPSMTE